MCKAPITSIQKFSTHDGPGVRTTVFLQGCPLRCIWCHNPETQKVAPQFFYNENLCVSCRECEAVCGEGVHIFDNEHKVLRDKCKGCLSCADACLTKAIEPCATFMSAKEIIDIVLQDKAFYGDKGGLCVSGGEPMFHPEFTLELLSLAKEQGINTAIETCGYFDKKYLEPLSRVCDVFLWDFKDGNPARHKKNTGVSNDKIIENLFALDKFDVDIILRCIMIRGINMDESNIEKIKEVKAKLTHLKGVDLLPYHTYGGSKYKSLGLEDKSNEALIPTDEDIENIKTQLQ